LSPPEFARNRAAYHKNCLRFRSFIQKFVIDQPAGRLPVFSEVFKLIGLLQNCELLNLYNAYSAFLQRKNRAPRSLRQVGSTAPRPNSRYRFSGGGPNTGISDIRVFRIFRVFRVQSPFVRLGETGSERWCE
jgi:hypothetical protein